MIASPLCVACGVERHAIAIELVTARYEIRSHECPNCKTVVRLVNARRTTTGKRKPAGARGIRTLKPKDWSEEEISQLIEMVGQKIKVGEIAKVLGRHVSSARTKARALGLIMDRKGSKNTIKDRGRPWTAHEEQQLHDMLAVGKTAKDVAGRLNRSPSSIYARLQRHYRKARVSKLQS
jgi:DNA-binding NarL/FixJ family response regulator